jgi:hypothetical protein
MVAKKPVNKVKIIIFLIIAIIGIIGIATSISNLLSAKHEVELAQEDVNKARDDCYAALNEYVHRTGHIPPEGDQCG